MSRPWGPYLGRYLGLRAGHRGRASRGGRFLEPRVRGRVLLELGKALVQYHLRYRDTNSPVLGEA